MWSSCQPFKIWFGLRFASCANAVTLPNILALFLSLHFELLYFSAFCTACLWPITSFSLRYWLWRISYTLLRHIVKGDGYKSFHILCSSLPRLGIFIGTLYLCYLLMCCTFQVCSCQKGRILSHNVKHSVYFYAIS